MSWGVTGHSVLTPGTSRFDESGGDRSAASGDLSNFAVSFTPKFQFPTVVMPNL